MALKRTGRKKSNNRDAGKRRTRRKKPQSFSARFASISTRYDMGIIFPTAILVIFGIVMVFSAGYYTTVNAYGDAFYYLKRQAAYVALGIVLMAAAARVDYHVYAGKFYWLWTIGSILLLGLLFTPLGVEVNSATRWFTLGPVNITPSELSKLAIIMFTATYLARNPRQVRKLPGICVLLAVMLVHAALIIKQPNLSTAIVICAIMLGIMFVAGMHLQWYALGAGAGVLGVFYILNFRKDTHWYARLTSFRNPFADAQGNGYQVSQSLIALGNGGIRGLGLGNSISKNLYLPFPQNDFILAIIGEELGFIGIVILMAIYLWLIYRCFLVAARAADKLGLYMASGITIMLALQVIINVAVVTASMPATGITLPFVSYGGTSLLVFMVSMGILLNIAKSSQKIEEEE